MEDNLIPNNDIQAPETASFVSPAASVPAADPAIIPIPTADQSVEGSAAVEAATPVPAAPNGESEGVLSESNKQRVCLKALRSIERDIANIIRLLEGGSSPLVENSTPARGPAMSDADLQGLPSVEGRVIEGVFDGANMVGSDGKIYTVPANYASKSKLVEGDLLKLTITPKGSFIYKQIGPIERSRVMGTLGFDATIGEFYAATENRRFNIIKASVTYFKGEPGDEAVLLVPKSTPSKWAAVENIIKRNPLA
ncbi:MAG: hypothetical protein WCT10_00595 [Patescibacteria group bacterium]|jgi:hypothetical protein